MLLNLTDILSLVSGHSGLSYWASGSLVTMTVNEEGTHLVLWHTGVTGVCPAGAGTAIWEHMEEAQAVTSALPFPSSRRPAQVGDPVGFLRFQVGMLKCRGMSLPGGRWAGASTAELLQLNYMQEVENNHISVPRCLQGAWSRAEMGTSC